MPTPSGLVTKQELIDAQLDTAHLGRVVNSKDAAGNPISQSTNRTGGVNATLDALLGAIGLYSVGFWTDDPTLTEVNQYVRDNSTGLDYQPVTLPYTVNSALNPDPETLATSGVLKRVNEVTQQDLIDQLGLLVGGSVYPGDDGAYVKNGDTIPVGTTHLILPVDGKSTLVLMQPVSNGLISGLSEVGAVVGGTNVTFITHHTKNFKTVYDMLAAKTIIGGYYSTGGTEFVKVSDIGGITDFEVVGDVLYVDDFNIPEVGDQALLLADVVALINAGTVRKAISNRNIITSQKFTFTPDDFELAGSGSFIVEATAAQTTTEIFVFSGARNKSTIRLYDGNRDNTNIPPETPAGSMVSMSGDYPTWGSNTANAQGYAATIRGKNPTILDHEDHNSHYSGVRLFPAEDWDFVKGGKVTYYKQALPNNSIRGLMINGKHYIDVIEFESYTGIGVGSLFDAETAGGADEREPYYRKVKFGSLVIKNPIKNDNTSQSLQKWENCGDVEIDYCDGFMDDSFDNTGFWFADCGGKLKIGSYECNQVSRLPNKVEISKCTLRDKIRLNEMFTPYASNEVVNWSFGSVIFDTSGSLGQVNTKSVFSSLNVAAGSKISVGSYQDAPNKVNLYRGDGGVPDCFSCSTPNWTQQITSASMNEVRDLRPRMVVAFSTTSLQGNIERGAIFIKQIPSAGGKWGEICTTPGVAGSTAVFKEFSPIDA